MNTDKGWSESLANKTDAELIDYIAGIRRPDAAAAELQRRTAVTMIQLTKWIIGLTVAIGILAAAQLAAAVWTMLR